jgi:hypothetical protein
MIVMRHDYKDEHYYLYDGTEVTKEQILQTAYRYQGTYKGLGAIMVAGVLITTIAAINEYDPTRLGFYVVLFAIDLILLILAILFFSMNKKMDLIKFGLSILNYRRRQLLNEEANSDDYNTIEANRFIDLRVRNRQFIFINEKTKMWQYRMGRYLSIPLTMDEIVSIEAKQMSPRLSHIIIALDDGSGVIMHCSSQELALSITELLKPEEPEEENE